MPTFDTPEPIAVSLNVLVATARITAEDRSDTVIDVVPSNPAAEADVRAAQQVTVDFSGGKLAVKSPKQWRHYSSFGGAGSIIVTLRLPAGSQLSSQMAMGEMHAEGRLGACRVAMAAGGISLDHVASAKLSSAAGDITVERVDGALELSCAGTIRIGEVQGKAVVKNINGDTLIGKVAGPLRCTGANGDIVVNQAHESVVAKTANGNIRIHTVGQGAVSLHTAAGELEVGIPEGTAAMLDVKSSFGKVRNGLTSASGPEGTDRTVEIRARTAFGDILIGRSTALASGSGER